MAKNTNTHLILKRNELYYNPLFIMDDKPRELQDIRFYDENGVVFATNRGWFDNGRNYDYIDIPSCPYRKANKLSFDKNDVFYMRGTSPENTVILYVPISLIENYTKHEHVIYSKTTNGDDFRTEHYFTWGNYEFIVYTDFGTDYNDITINRHKVFSELDIMETYDIMVTLKKLKDHNVKLEDII